MTPVDLEPAARRLAELIGGVPDELLDAPTPCPAYTLGDLVEHVGGAASAFTGAADLPGEVAGLVALDEVVVHGWDVARATGQPYECDASSLEAVHAFVSQFSEPGQEAARSGLFGPVVEVPDEAPLLDRVIGLTGRDPAWSPG